MANYKISQLPSSSALTSDDFLPIVDSGTLTTQRATAQQLLDYVTGSTFNSLTVTNLTASNITASNIQTYEQRVDDVLNANFLRVSGTSLVTDIYQDTSTRFVVDTSAQHFQFFKLATPVTAGFGNASTSLTKVDGIDVEIGNASSTVKVAGILTGSTGRFTTLSSSNSVVSGNFVLQGQADLTAYPDYAYIIYTSSYDKLVVFPGLYVSGSLTGSGNAKFNEVSGTIAQFSEISASIISASSYIGATATFGIIKSPNITTYGDSSIGTVLYTNDSEQITGDYNKLLFDYSNNILSGVIADFDQITGSVSFTANDPALWASPTPITIQDAINRIAAAVYSGNTGLIA